MSSFRSWRSFHDFDRTIGHTARYILKTAAIRLLEELFRTSATRRVRLPKGITVHRTKRGHAYRPMFAGDGNTVIDEEPDVYAKSRMIPRADRAREGRVNAKGIQCLYLCTDLDTSIAEVRPWLEEIVTVAYFETGKAIDLVDFPSTRKTHMYYFREPAAKPVGAVLCRTARISFKFEQIDNPVKYS